jgi:hypothetical protein
MSLFAAIKSHLLHHSKVALLVGDRVFHMAVLGQRAPRRPYIVFQIIDDSGEDWRHMANAGTVTDAEVQIACYGDKDTQSCELANEVRKSLDHANHRDIGRAPDTVTVRGAFWRRDIPDYTPDPDGREWGTFKVIQEWTIRYEHSLPELAV